MHLTWLIQGHLTESDAVEMVRTAETALDYSPMQKDDLAVARLVKLAERTVYNFERDNEIPSNPNSVCEAVFMHTF